MDRLLSSLVWSRGLTSRKLRQHRGTQDAGVNTDPSRFLSFVLKHFVPVRFIVDNFSYVCFLTSVILALRDHSYQLLCPVDVYFLFK